jgi:hypothetical protein
MLLIPLIITVTLGFFCLRGFPQKVTGYRVLFAFLVILGAAATIEAVLLYFTSRYYFPEQPVWPFLFLAAFGVACIVVFLSEFVFLIRFRARAKKAPNQ